MHHEKEIETGLVVYPGAQQAAVLGLADLFGIAAGSGRSAGPVLRVTHWRQHAPESAPVLDTADAADASGVLHALVVPPGGWRPAPGVFAPRLAHGDAAVLKAQHWLQATQAKDVALASLARAAGLEKRTFLRRFQKATGMTSTEYCRRLRVGRARELLASARLSIDRVAWEVGYADPGAFRKVFTRIAGVAPGEYRRRCEAEQGARAA